MNVSLKRKIPPLVLGALIVAADQAVKALIVALSRGKPGVIANWGVDFLYIVHQRNLGAAFSLMDGLPPQARIVVLGVLPLVVLAAVVVFYFRSAELTRLQDWALMAMVGGGLGNLIDRLARPAGVVDFISVKFFGIFGLERWPTFNVADSAVVVGALAMIASFVAQAIAGLSARRGHKVEGSK